MPGAGNIAPTHDLMMCFHSSEEGAPMYTMPQRDTVAGEAMAMESTSMIRLTWGK